MKVSNMVLMVMVMRSLVVVLLVVVFIIFVVFFFVIEVGGVFGLGFKGVLVLGIKILVMSRLLGVVINVVGIK